MNKTELIFRTMTHNIQQIMKHSNIILNMENNHNNPWESFVSCKYCRSSLIELAGIVGIGDCNSTIYTLFRPIDLSDYSVISDSCHELLANLNKIHTAIINLVDDDPRNFVQWVPTKNSYGCRDKGDPFHFHMHTGVTGVSKLDTYTPSIPKVKLIRRRIHTIYLSDEHVVIAYACNGTIELTEFPLGNPYMEIKYLRTYNTSTDLHTHLDANNLSGATMRRSALLDDIPQKDRIYSHRLATINKTRDNTTHFSVSQALTLVNTPPYTPEQDNYTLINIEQFIDLDFTGAEVHIWSDGATDKRLCRLTVPTDTLHSENESVYRSQKPVVILSPYAGSSHKMKLPRGDSPNEQCITRSWMSVSSIFPCEYTYLVFTVPNRVVCSLNPSVYRDHIKPEFQKHIVEIQKLVSNTTTPEDFESLNGFAFRLNSSKPFYVSVKNERTLIYKVQN